MSIVRTVFFFVLSGKRRLCEEKKFKFFSGAVFMLRTHGSFFDMVFQNLFLPS